MNLLVATQNNPRLLPQDNLATAQKYENLSNIELISKLKSKLHIKGGHLPLLI
jgi:hypothetical protein